MKDPLLILTFIIAPTFVLAQDHVYTYTKQSDGFLLASEGRTVTFGNYKRNEERIMERSITMDSVAYVSRIKKSKKGNVEEIVNAQGETQATVLLSTIDAYDIILPDGTQLKWSGITNKKWSYSNNGKIVIQGSLQKVGGKKQLVLSGLDSSVPGNVVQFITLERGADKIGTSSHTVGMIIMAVVVGSLPLIAGSAR